MRIYVNDESIKDWSISYLNVIKYTSENLNEYNINNVREFINFSNDTLDCMYSYLNELEIRIYFCMVKYKRYVGIEKLCKYLGLEYNIKNQKIVSCSKKSLIENNFISYKIRKDKYGRETATFKILKK